jgi:hypothetical protein
MERSAMWSTWLERTLRTRDADDYAARRTERDRAYAHLRHEDAVALRHAAVDALAAKPGEMTDAA